MLLGTPHIESTKIIKNTNKNLSENVIMNISYSFFFVATYKMYSQYGKKIINTPSSYMHSHFSLKIITISFFCKYEFVVINWENKIKVIVCVCGINAHELKMDTKLWMYICYYCQFLLKRSSPSVGE